MSKKILVPTLCLLAALASAIVAATHNFVPDSVFQGSSVAGLRTVGPAEWKAAGGEITGTPQGGSGGWLVLDKSYQDIEFATDFHCSARCDAGVLLRAEKTNDGGLKGVYVSLSEGDLKTYDLTIGSDGKEVSRKALERATGQFTRIAAGPWANGSAHVPGFAEPAATVAEQAEEAAKPKAVTAAGDGSAGRGGPPPPTVRPNDWNSFDAIVDMDMVWLTLNGRRGGNTATNDRMMSYGPVVLHVGGSGEVRFKDISAKI